MVRQRWWAAAGGSCLSACGRRCLETPAPQPASSTPQTLTVTFEASGLNIDTSAATMATTPAILVAPMTAGKAAGPPITSCAQVAAAEAAVRTSRHAVLLTTPLTVRGPLEPRRLSTIASSMWPKPAAC